LSLAKYWAADVTLATMAMLKRWFAPVCVSLTLIGCSDREIVPAPASAVEAYEDNIRDAYTSDVFHPVWITVVDGRTGMSTRMCTDAAFLLGAIHKEQGISYDEQSVERVMKIALDNRARTFRFSKPDAIANLGGCEKQPLFP
jgi:hypothetical protein